MFNGQGHYKWNDGRQFIGNYENGLMKGFGVFTWKDGQKYTGEYLNDLKHG